MDPTNYPTTNVPTTTIPTTEAPTTAIPTTLIPTSEIPTSSNPTTNIPTTINPTTSLPTKYFPITTVSSTSLSIKIETATTNNNNEAVINSVTNNVIATLTDNIALDNESESDDLSVLIIIISACLLISIIICIILCFKIYKKKKSKTIIEKITDLSKVEMNTINPSNIHKNNNNVSTTLNKLEVDDESRNSIEGMFEQPIISILTHDGETSTGDITNAHSVPIGTTNNIFINNEREENDDSAYNDNYNDNDMDGYNDDDDNDKDMSDTEKLYENNNENITTKGLNDKYENTNNIKLNDGNNMEGYIKKKYDQHSNELDLLSNGHTTKGIDDGNV